MNAQERAINLIEQLEEIAPKLSENNLEQVIFYARTLRSFEKTRIWPGPPTADQWNKFSNCSKWKFLLKLNYYYYSALLEQEINKILARKASD